MEPITVLIVEDEASIADSIIYALESEGFKTSHALTASDGLKLCKEVSPGFIILDIGLPDGNGFDLCREIRKFSSAPLLFLTARTGEIDRILGLELGGDDYLAKPFSPRELVARVKAILRRLDRTVAPSESKLPTRFVVDDKRKAVIFHGKPLDLSRYEYLLLVLLLKTPGRVYSREQLMNLIWDTPEMSLERTIDTHIKSIRSKLKAIDEEDESIVTHRGFGYSLKEAI